jgi:hypothetical protein
MEIYGNPPASAARPSCIDFAAVKSTVSRDAHRAAAPWDCDTGLGAACPGCARRWAPTYGRGGDRPRRQGLRARGQQLGLRGDHPRHGGLGGATAARPGLVPLRGSAHRARGVARAGQHAAHDRPASGGGRGAGGRGRGRRRAGAARAGRGGRGGGGGDDGRGQGGHLRSGGAPAAACLAAHCGDEGDA